MSKATETIDHTTLHRLVVAGAVRAVHVVGTIGQNRLPGRG